jgi:hypothetical protein
MSTQEEVLAASERMQKAQRALLDDAAKPTRPGLSMHSQLARELEEATGEYLRLVLDVTR